LLLGGGKKHQVVVKGGEGRKNREGGWVGKLSHKLKWLME